jgi:capsid protein
MTGFHQATHLHQSSRIQQARGMPILLLVILKMMTMDERLDYEDRDGVLKT